MEQNLMHLIKPTSNAYLQKCISLYIINYASNAYFQKHV